MAWAVAIGVAGMTASAAASEPEQARSDDDARPSTPWEQREGQAHTMFQAGVGLLALPAAEVCPSSPTECEPGETSIAFNALALGRFSDFAFGAGVTWAFGLRPADPAPGGPDEALEREHSRSYFEYSAQFRYYLPRFGSWEWWVGSSLGGVVVNDSWSVLADREPYADIALIGPRSVTLGTEGLALGLSAGGHWRFSEYWVFGAHIRYGNWFLEDRDRTPVGDFASLAGRVDIIDFGLAVAFRLPFP